MAIVMKIVVRAGEPLTEHSFFHYFPHQGGGVDVRVGLKLIPCLGFDGNQPILESFQKPPR